MGKPEDFVEKYLTRRCKALGFGCLKFTSPGTSGVPDRIVIGNGRTVFVETKRAGEKLRRLQEVIITEMRTQGADVRVADTRELVDALLSEISGSPSAEEQKPTPNIVPLLRRELAAALPEATPEQIEALLDQSRRLGAELREQHSGAGATESLPPSCEGPKATINRIEALAGRWETIPSLRRGPAAKDLREALAAGQAQ